MDQEGMKTQLSQIHKLMQYTDPELCNYLGMYTKQTVERALFKCHTVKKHLPCEDFPQILRLSTVLYIMLV